MNCRAISISDLNSSRSHQVLRVLAGYKYYQSSRIEGRRKPASCSADINEDVVAFVCGHNASVAGLLVQPECALHIAQLLTGHQQAAIGHCCRCHILLLHVIKHLRTDVPW